MGIIEWLKRLFSAPEELAECNRKYADCDKERNDFLTSLRTVRENLSKKEAELAIAAEQITELQNQVPKIDPWETHYNSKYPKQDISYIVHETDAAYEIDVRNFFQYKDFNLPAITGANNDEKALNALLWVIANVKYTHDKETYGFDEYWAFPWQTLKRKVGDCVSVEEEIYTEDGTSKVGELKEGQIVLSYDFEAREFCWKPITKIWEKGELPIRRVHFRNGATIDVSEGHPFWIRTGQKESSYEKTLLKDVDLARWWKRKTPCAKEIPQYREEDIAWLNEDLCFITGHFIAEGWIENSHVCTSGYDCHEIAERLESNNLPFGEGKNGNGVPIISFHKSEFKTFLGTLKKNSLDINLPEWFFRLPIKKLQAFLNGYFLGDGNLIPPYGKNNPTETLNYSTSSEQFAKDLCRIHLILGKSLYFWKQEHHGGAGKNPIWRLRYNSNSAFCRDFGYKGLSEVSISFVEDLPIVKMRDIEVNGTNSFVFKNGLIGHNCEDGAILLANILMKAGVPYWRVRLNAGNVWDGKTTAGFLKAVDISYFGDKTRLLKKEIDYGIIQEAKQQGLNQANEFVNEQNLRQALFLGTKEPEKTEFLFANMVGKQSKIDPEFAKAVEQLIQKENLAFTTSTKTDSTIIQKIYKYYVALAIANYMESKEILDNLEKDSLHGTKDSNSNNTAGIAGHCFVTYCRETDNKFVVLDWCYWANKKPIAERLTHEEERNYNDIEKNFYVWFSFNCEYSFGKMQAMTSMPENFVRRMTGNARQKKGR